MKEIVEKYQCVGCVSGPYEECFVPCPVGWGVGCSKHVAGTTMLGRGKLFLGMPRGFNRLGEIKISLSIYETFRDVEKYCKYGKYNVPVWKHLTEDGHVLVRGLSPRINGPFLHVILENCLDKIDCMEITAQEISEMD